MSDPYHSVKAGRLTFKGGSVATISKSIDKKKKKHKKTKQQNSPSSQHPAKENEAEETVAENVYTIDAAKKMNYQEIFPVEARKFGYDPSKAKEKTETTVEAALDDRVKKKADRYCK